MIALLGAAPAAGGAEQPIYRLGRRQRRGRRSAGSNSATRMPKECADAASEPRDVVLTAKVWKDLVRVNKWVNERSSR